MPLDISFINNVIVISDNENRALLRKNTNKTAGAGNYFCNFIIDDAATVQDIINFISETRKQIQALLSFTNGDVKIHWFEHVDNTLLGDSVISVELLLTRKMHRLVSVGNFAQKLEYVRLVGLRPEIARQSEFFEIQEFRWLQGQLRKLGIPNHIQNTGAVRRIHVVHPYYLRHDEEVCEELKVTHAIHSKDNPLFVSSHSSLCYALELCEPGTTLVINGHWAHGKSMMYGIWDMANSEGMSKNISDVVNKYPGKIDHINLLGCESGALDDELSDNTCINKLFFKYDKKPEKALREMAEFRNRAHFISAQGESVFHPNSLAFLLLAKLDDRSIAVSAPPSLDYPFPPENPRFNIGSDSVLWKTKSHFWLDPTQGQESYRLLKKTKSITQVHASVMLTHRKKPWI